MKKVISILLVVCIMLSIVPFAMAAEHTHADVHGTNVYPCCDSPNLYYGWKDGKVVIYCLTCNTVLSS